MRRVDSMVAVQRHRGPDGFGTWRDPTGHVALGHARLSIIDLSDRGRQPMASYDGGMVLVFNGEIYNFIELKAELREYPYHSDTDTEVLLAAYERWGEDCVERLNGMFSFALWDRRRRRLFCVRDRMGIKPLYFAELGSELLFASEIKALLAAGVRPRPNDSAIHDYLIRGRYDHSDYTFFEGVRSLGPGHVLVWEPNQPIRTWPYWDLGARLSRDEPPQSAPPTWREELSELLDDAVRLRLRADVPVGLHLSGGLDSSVLLAALSRQLPSRGRLEAFTAVFGNAAYDEDIHSELVADSLDLRVHRSLMELQDFWSTAETVQWHQEQPFGGLSTMAYWALERVVRDSGVAVVLEGQGGDELFGGYAYYAGDYLRDLVRAGRDTEASTWLKRYAAAHGVCAEHVRARLQDWGPSTYQDGSSFLRPDCLTRDFLAEPGLDVVLPAPASSSFANSRYRDVRHTKLPRVLRFNDRMSMSAGRELRVPLLDHRVVEYAFSLPDDLLIAAGLPKMPLRDIARGRLPDSVRLAPKRAVVTPQREWFRGPLRSSIRERLAENSLASMGYLDSEAMVRVFDDFCRDPEPENSFFVWQWLNLDLWMRCFVINRPGPSE